MSKTKQESSSDDDGVARAWNGFVAVAGATAGIAALIYFVGAVTLWARLRAAGLPADVALQHFPREQLIALGFRGVAVIIGIIAVAVAALCAGILATAYVSTSREHDSTEKPGRAPAARATIRRAKEEVRAHNLLDAGGKAVRRIKLGWFRIWGALGIAAIVGASFRSWHLFAAAIAYVAVIAATLRYLHERHPDRRNPSLTLLASTLLAVGVAATAWQVQPPVYVQTASLVPMPDARAKGAPVDFLASVGVTPLPYLGETEKYVYVAQIVRAKRGGWSANGTMIEVPRDAVRLVFPSRKGRLYHRVSSPARSLWNAVR
jgi:hypothetical protein